MDGGEVAGQVRVARLRGESNGLGGRALSFPGRGRDRFEHVSVATDDGSGGYGDESGRQDEHNHGRHDFMEGKKREAS